MGALSDKFRRLAVLLEPEVARMAAKQAAHIGHFDDAQFDAAQEIATFWRGEDATWRCHAEPIGRLNPDFGLFRWWWHGRSAAARKSRLDPVIKEGDGYQIGELVTDHVEVASEDEAHLLAKVAAQIARADGVLRIEDEYGISFIALFEGTPAPQTLRKLAPKQELAPQSVGGEVSLGDDDLQPISIEPEPASVRSIDDPRFSVPVPTAAAIASAVPLTAPNLTHTIPPTPLAFQIAGARATTPPPVRIPTREVVASLVQEALAVTTRATNGEFAQALLSVVVEVDEGAAVKGRFFVDVVALDPKGELVSVDATHTLIEAAAHTIAADAQSGNGRWRKLLVRLRRTPRGASVEVDVRL